MQTSPNVATPLAASASLRCPHAAARRTPGLLLGPYYPLATAGVQQPRLWQHPSLPAGVRQLELAGRVTNVRGQAVVDARVELWHADPCGHYRHPSAPAGVLDGFAGYGAMQTDREGRFAFSTLEPGAYSERDLHRAPHLHLQVTGRYDRLVTQLFLPHHELNAQDYLYSSLRQPELLIPTVIREDQHVLHLHWNAVLSRG